MNAGGKRAGWATRSWSVMLLAAGLSGCQSPGTAKHVAMVAVEITGHSAAEIYQTAELVFGEHGYQPALGFSFERKGSTMDTLAYGGWSGDPTWVRVKLSLSPRGDDTFYVSGDIYLVLDHGNPAMEEQQKPLFSKRHECQKILDQMKSRLAQHSAPVNP